MIVKFMNEIFAGVLEEIKKKQDKMEIWLTNYEFKVQCNNYIIINKENFKNNKEEIFKIIYDKINKNINEKEFKIIILEEYNEILNNEDIMNKIKIENIKEKNILCVIIESYNKITSRINTVGEYNRIRFRYYRKKDKIKEFILEVEPEILIYKTINQYYDGMGNYGGGSRKILEEITGIEKLNSDQYRMIINKIKEMIIKE